MAPQTLQDHEIPSAVIIRDARPAELAEVGELRVAAYRADGFLSETSTYAARLRSLGGDGTGTVLVAVQQGTILGTVMLQGGPQAGEVVQGPDEAEVRALAVAKQAQGRGIGRDLLQGAIGRAAEQGIRHLVLCTQHGDAHRPPALRAGRVPAAAGTGLVTSAGGHADRLRPAPGPAGRRSGPALPKPGGTA